MFVNLVNSKFPLKSIYNSPSYRTYADKIAKQFNKESKVSCIKVNNIGTGATYPRMLSNYLQKDLGYRLKYSSEKSIKDWMNELKHTS